MFFTVRDEETMTWRANLLDQTHILGYVSGFRFRDHCFWRPNSFHYSYVFLVFSLSWLLFPQLLTSLQWPSLLTSLTLPVSFIFPNSFFFFFYYHYQSLALFQLSEQKGRQKEEWTRYHRDQTMRSTLYTVLNDEDWMENERKRQQIVGRR